ncbi:gas vesicle structural protein GvpA [Streptomyces bungoensis]|uniref:gas vesicle structural protein GvpA n=1 Tax=Streptomyces bungoensis TaxID=285568 RepID=UPI00341E1818
MITYDDEIVCAPRAGTLYDVLELILDRGMVIDVFARVSLVGIEILKVDARIVIASVDTYLRFAEACNRLDLEHDVRSKTVPELFGGPAAKTIAKAGARRTARSLSSKVRGILSPESTEEDEIRTRAPARRRREPEEEPPRRRPAPERRRPAARPRGDEDEHPRPRARRPAREE